MKGPKPRPAPPFPIADPVKIAHRLLGKDVSLDREILYELLGRQRRYSELRVLLRGRRDHNLTVALRRLEDDGLVDQRVDTRQRPVVRTYELSVLGIFVVRAMDQLQVVRDLIERHPRAARA